MPIVTRSLGYMTPGEPSLTQPNAWAQPRATRNLLAAPHMPIAQSLGLGLRVARQEVDVGAVHKFVVSPIRSHRA
jgi:hypothetical protein